MTKCMTLLIIQLIFLKELEYLVLQKNALIFRRVGKNC